MAGSEEGTDARAATRVIRDVIAPDLEVLFCGVNPGLYSAQVGHNFARPGNRFWPVIHRAGFTPRQLRPDEERELLRYGCGITNIVARPSARAEELSRDELIAGARALERRVKRYRPGVLAIVGIGAYRTAFARPRAPIGLQEETIGDTKIWLLPNPSGLNANYTPAQLVEAYRALRDAVATLASPRSFR